MISFHPGNINYAAAYNFYYGFKKADTNDVKRLCNALLHWVWSPIVWQDGMRKEKNFLCANWCVLDFDDGETTLAEACRMFCDRIHIIGTTKSHQKDKGGRICDRFRLAFQFTNEITDVRTYRWNMYNMIRHYDVDPACKDGARFFWPCIEIIQFEAEGYQEEVDLNVPEWFDKPPTLARYKSAGQLPPWTREKLASIIPEGERNTTCYRMAKDLTLLGLDAENVLALIIHSKTYNGAASTSLLQELKALIKSAARSINPGTNKHTKGVFNERK